MMPFKNKFDAVLLKTKLAFFLSGIFNEPLVGLLTVLPFILRKEFNVTTLQIALFNAFKPVVSLFSFYWGAALWRNQKNLRFNWIIAWFLARVPFLLFPFIDNSWVFMICVAIFYFFHRGSVPAQMEILKQNVPLGLREHVFSWSSICNFTSGILIGLVMGNWVKEDHHDWKILFFFSAIVGLLSIFFQRKVPIYQKQIQPSQQKKNFLLSPWVDSWNLLLRDKEFAHFQAGFMLGGIGLMLMMPAVVLYAADELSLQHTSMIFSRFICMGIGFVLATPFWKKWMCYSHIYRLTGLICLFFTLTALCWVLASVHLAWFFIAFFFYGVAQSGSHLIWHLSGPLFSGNQDSSLYSTVNILTVGLRGLVVPFVGGLLCHILGFIPVLIIGGLCCLFGALYFFGLKSSIKRPISENGSLY